MRKWRLGLDLGTNSIGWSALELDDTNKPQSVFDLGVRIFSDGRDPKSKEPLAVARRVARGIRRNIHRRKQRRRAVFALLQKEGLYPTQRVDAQKLKGMNPYELRTRALDSKLEPFELGRALFHLAVRRGFKSNRKEMLDEIDSQKQMNESKKTTSKAGPTQSEKAEGLMQAIRDSKARSLGEFLWTRLNKGDGIRFTPDRSSYYPLRSLYEIEFELISEKQGKYYPSIAWDAIRDTIFFQRPLRKQERGKCQFIKDKERAFKALPSSHLCRILQEVLNLVYYDNQNRPVPLSDAQADILINELNTHEKMTFSAMRKRLGIEGQFNLETANREELKGNSTAKKMRSDALFGNRWDSIPLQEQDDIVETMITADEDEQVVALLKKYNLPKENEQKILRTYFSSGTTSICKEFTQKIVSVMQDTRLQYFLAVKSLGYDHSDQEVEKVNELPYYGQILQGSTMGGDIVKYPDTEPEKKYGKIGNPTVHVALNQIRTVVNTLISTYGKPTQIVIELSRDLKLSRDDKKKEERRQAENAKRNTILNANITDLCKTIIHPGRFERLKYRLWEELGTDSSSRRCLYCGAVISASELYTQNIEVEHILPFSRTLLDAESNLTLAHKKCNAYKAERSPYEAFGSSPRGYSWEDIHSRVSVLRNPSKKAKFNQDAMEAFDKDSGFITRQLTDNAYLSRISLKYVRSICDDVWAVSGGMTYLLRNKWNIDEILKRKLDEETIVQLGIQDAKIGYLKKNRLDHRHHALDALVIGLIDRGLVKQISDLNARSMRSRLEAPVFPFDRAEVIEKIRSIVPSFKPDHGKEGKLSKETYLGKILREYTVPMISIQENDVQNIKIEKVRDDVLKKTQELGNHKQALKALEELYPSVKVFKAVYVTRESLATMKEENVTSIVDVSIRRRLQQYISERKGVRIETILQGFIEETGIRKVRCETRIQTPIEIKPDQRNPLSVSRYLNPEDYFVAVVWKIPPRKDGGKCSYKAQYVRRDQLDKNGSVLEDRPDPTASKVCELHKDDYIEFFDNKVVKLARIAGYATTQNKLDIRPVFASSSISDWLVATCENMIEQGWKMADGQNFVSINVLFGEYAARRVTVNPCGKVFRKKR